MSNEENYLYEFGAWRIDPVKRRLLRDGEPVQLTPKVFDLLFALVERSGKAIEKDELMEKIWPDTVVEENNITQNISILRKIFGDSRNESRYIETIPGFGYRFVANVQKVFAVDDELIITDRSESRIVLREITEQDEGERTDKQDMFPITAGSESLPAATGIRTIGESLIFSIKLHKKIAILVLVLGIFVLGGIAFWVYRLAQSSDGISPGDIEATLLTLRLVA